jgi:integrase
MALTQQIINRLKPEPKPYEIRCDKLKGFLIRVQPSGALSYVCQYARGKRITLGDARVLTLEQARTKAREILGQVATGGDPQAERKPKAGPLTLDKFLCDHYGPWQKTHHRRGDTEQRLRAAFPDLLEKPLPDITPWLIEKHRKARKEHGTAETTINRDVVTLKAALNRAVDWEFLDVNPLAPVKQLKTDRQGVIRYLDTAEERRLLAALELLPAEKRLRPMVLVSMHTGLRWGELAALRWPDVDLQTRLLTVRGAGAKSKQTRYVPLNDTAHAALAAWAAHCQADADGDADAPLDGLTFPGKAGALDNVTKSWATLLKAAGIKDFRWHDLRHHFASRLVQNGVDLNTVRELMGHADIKMTLRYSHLAPEHRAAAVARIG